ncbi:hypothetical protein ASC96_17755 [Rhizobium sp. Root1204]|nr:sialidase family protein [Rhizobium sp. Root1204]KQV41685.1 hypothetical protein ASC96_17755 [Rhizobium sp. Root1204]
MILDLGPDPSRCVIARPQHVEVYRKAGEFAGWPANYGLWIWDDEVVVVFAQGLLGREGKIHARDRDHPFRPLQARSHDGGMTWAVEPFLGQVPGAETLSADEHVVEGLRAGRNIIPGRDLQPLTIPIDFLDLDTIVMAARTGISRAVSWFYVSRDRARTWQGPYAFGDFGLPGISARTDLIPVSANEALFMLTSSKSDGNEGRIFCARTTDGGRTFSFQGFLMEETKGYAIMPSSVRLPEGRIVTAARRMGAGEEGWIDIFMSDDLGITWRQVGGPVPTGFGGNPGALQILPDGRLALIYGYRDKLYGIRLRMSDDGGRTWSRETVIRRDGGSPDLGYPRVVVKPDGSLLCVYYFNEKEDGERFIAASVVMPKSR